MKNKTKVKEIDIHCACARGVLLEFSDVKPVKNTETKVEKKILKTDVPKKADLNNKQ